jgi:hypothetical protein
LFTLELRVKEERRSEGLEEEGCTIVEEKLQA